jgi:hypothetical protein
MTLDEFLNGIRVLWNIDAEQYLACINKEDREYFGDSVLWLRFQGDPHRTFSGLPDQDQRRLFALVERRNADAGISA